MAKTVAVILSCVKGGQWFSFTEPLVLSLS